MVFEIYLHFLTKFLDTFLSVALLVWLLEACIADRAYTRNRKHSIQISCATYPTSQSRSHHLARISSLLSTCVFTGMLFSASHTRTCLHCCLWIESISGCPANLLASLFLCFSAIGADANSESRYSFQLVNSFGSVLAW